MYLDLYGGIFSAIEKVHIFFSMYGHWHRVRPPPPSDSLAALFLMTHCTHCIRQVQSAAYAVHAQAKVTRVKVWFGDLTDFPFKTKLNPFSPTAYLLTCVWEEHVNFWDSSELSVHFASTCTHDSNYWYFKNFSHRVLVGLTRIMICHKRCCHFIQVWSCKQQSFMHDHFSKRFVMCSAWVVVAVFTSTWRKCPFSQTSHK